MVLVPHQRIFYVLTGPIVGGSAGVWVNEGLRALYTDSVLKRDALLGFCLADEAAGMNVSPCPRVSWRDCLKRMSRAL